MIDVILFIGRIVLVVLLYIFLFAVMKTGVGLVRGQRRDSAIWTIDVDKGPRGIRGIHVDMLGPVIVGRSPSSDICINEPFVSASHARFSLQGPALVIEDLNSLNGTLVNGRQLLEPATLREGDEAAAEELLARQAAFMDAHLLNWVPRFADAMARTARTDFYRGLARFLAGWLQEDRATLAELGAQGECRA